jgi:hypothetical protein
MLGPCFIKKWSKHPAHFVKGKEVECNFGMVGDATWKIARFKCIQTSFVLSLALLCLAVDLHQIEAHFIAKTMMVMK